MSFPPNDPNDPRYNFGQGHGYGGGGHGGGYAPGYGSDHGAGHGGGAGASDQYFLYGHFIEVDADDEPYNGQSTSSYIPPSSYPNGYQPSIAGGSTSSSSVYNDYSSRGIPSTAPTAPEDYLAPVMSGQRCIFHWSPVECRFKAHVFDDWVMHIDTHFKLPQPGNNINGHRRDYGPMPISWTCLYNYCGAVESDDDHQSLWDKKLAHMYNHLLNDRAVVEKMPEDPNWMTYYTRMNFCNRSEASGFGHYPPSQRPHIQPVMTFRKRPKGVPRGDLRQDASGEPTQLRPDLQSPPGSYGYPPYANPPNVQGQFYQQQMNPGPFPPTVQDYYR